MSHAASRGHRISAWTTGVVALLLLSSCALGDQLSDEACADTVVARLRIDEGHPWRPPFGLDRIGRPLAAVAELSSEHRPMRDYSVVGYRAGVEVERHALNIVSRGKALYGGTAEFRSHPDEIALFSRCRYQGRPIEIARTPVATAEFEADAVAAPDTLLNPVDLGAILPPHNWLLLAHGQKPIVDVAAISHRHAVDARIRVWFQSSGQPVEASLRLEPGVCAKRRIELPPVASALDRDVLHIAIVQPSGMLWSKDISVMLVANPPRWPAFGAVATKLRYDPPISVREATGRYSTLNYRTAWDPTLQDVVVFLPNGSRFVFWRGSSYIPFWAGRHNTGLSYEWAETNPPADGFVDSVEPLMDKELRYSRVQIVESTAARVHVRWTYQSTDFQYKVWGDAAMEDYYFYPDGFGTRVLTLRSKPGADYELSEFIILTPQSAYPLEVLPSAITDLLFLDGEKVRIPCPFPRQEPGYQSGKIPNPRKIPIVYRNHIHKEEAATAIYFFPGDTTTPIAFQPFHDRGYLVTPTYWGSHWPLGRGKSTGWSIDDRIDTNPAHNSVMTWGMNNRPIPLYTAEMPSVDTLGVSRILAVRRWAWLIAMTDLPDARLLDWAQSFSRPPSVDLEGGHLDFAGYVPERRALRIHVDKKSARVRLRPVARAVNPVIEVVSAPGNLVRVSLDGRPLDRRDYAWDGKVLWLNATFDHPAEISLQFE